MLNIRPMTAADADAVLMIYRLGIDTGNATFDTTAPTWQAFDAARRPEHRLAACDEHGQVLGWVAVSSVSARAAYAEWSSTACTCTPNARERGVGRVLLEALIASTEAAGIWTIQSGVFPEYTASLALHQRVGFRVVGVRERPARLHGVWRDVVAVERGSAVAGTTRRLS